MTSRASLHPFLPLLSLLLAAIALPSIAAAQARPLIQLHASTRHGVQLADQDLFVATDGTATGQLVTADPVTGLGWVLNAKTARASAAQLMALQSALGAAKVGVQPGDCKIVSQFVVQGTAELRWYGRGVRKNTLEFQIDSGENDACPAEVQQLYKAIEQFAGAVLGQGAIP